MDIFTHYCFRQIVFLLYFLIFLDYNKEVNIKVNFIHLFLKKKKSISILDKLNNQNLGH